MFGMSRMWMAVSKAIQAIVLIPKYSYEEYVKSLYPKAFWRFSEIGAATTMADELDLYNGTYTGSPNLDSVSLIVDDNDTSITFDTTTRYAATNGAVPFNNAQFAVSLSFTVNSYTATRTILHHGDNSAGGQQGYSINITTAGALRVSYFNGAWNDTTTADGVVTIGTTYHLVISRDTIDSLLYIYLDAVEMVNENPGNISLTSRVLYVGITYSGGGKTNQYSGIIDELAFYSRGLTQQEVTNLYNLSKANLVNKPDFYHYAKSLNPFAYWKLGESIGTKVYDLSGNNYHGDYVNAPTLGATGLLVNDSDTAVFYDGISDYSNLNDIITDLSAYTTGTVVFMATFPAGGLCSIELASTTSDTIYIQFYISESLCSYAYRNAVSAGTEFFTIDTVETFNADTVYQIAIVQDDTQGALIYVNGTLRATQVTTGTAGNRWWDDLSLNTASINALRGLSNTYRTGTVDEVKIYTSRLTVNEIKNLYLLSQSIPETPITYEHGIRRLWPIAYWRLGEIGAATVAVDEIVTYDGTYINAPNLDSLSLLVGDSNTSAAFNGTNQYTHCVDSQSLVNASLENIGAIDTAWTVSFLFSTTATTGAGNYWYGDDVIFEMREQNASGQIPFSIGMDSNKISVGCTYGLAPTSRRLSALTYNDGKAYLLTCAFVNTAGSIEVFIYVDSVLIDTYTFPSTGTEAIDGLCNLVIGCRTKDDGTVANYFDGIIDEVNIFDYELSQEEITDLYNKSQATNLMLTIDHTKVPEDLYDAPILINLAVDSGVGDYDATSVFESLDNGLGASEIEKLQLLYPAQHDQSSAQCNVEIDRWDSINKQAQLWVKIPFVSKDTDTIIGLIADSSNASNASVGYTGSPQAQSVWSEYDAVYHLSADGTDSTVNANHGTLQNIDGTNIVDFGIGKGMTFNGSNEWIDFGLNSKFNLLSTESMTAEVIFESSASTTFSQMALQNRGTGGLGSQGGLVFYAEDGNKYTSLIDTGSGAYSYAAGDSSTTMSYGTKYNITNTFEQSNGNAVISLDGSIVRTIPQTGDMTDVAITASRNTTIGCAWDNASTQSQFMNGKLKEVRFSKTLKSVGWTQANSHSLNDNLITYSVKS